MMSIKRFLFPLAAALMLACGFAFASVGQADNHEGFAKYQLGTDAAYAVLPAGKPVVAEHEAGGVDVQRSPVLRSDMRVASAGLVFKGAMDVVQRESSAPS